MAATGSRVLVYGGKGALGSAIVQHFKTKNWWVGSIDFFQNDDADVNILIEKGSSWVEQESIFKTKVQETLGETKVDAILCVAGGWAGGSAKSKDLVKNTELMCSQSVLSSVIAASLASSHLNEDGVLALTGAQPALSATPGMIGYGMAKAAVHQLVKSLSQPGSGLPNDTFVSAILPVTLDTPMNRKWMSKEDTSKWTPLETVAELFFDWTQKKDRPENGSLVQLFTKEGKTEFVPA